MAYTIPDTIDLGNERYVKPLHKENKKPQEALFSVERPRRGFDKLVLPPKTEIQLKSLLTKIKNYDLLYNKFGLKEIDATGGRTSINLYGPPGTGKSMAAEAIAYELGKKIIRVNYAEIESKYVGETPKNIRAVFNAAKEEDAVIIFDEADSILGKRLSNITQSTDHAVNVSKSVTLLELDAFPGITIFTTNFGSNYDGAFVRRILGHIKFELPHEEGRRKILKKLIPEKLPLSISEEEENVIIEETEGFSGGDMVNMVIYASSSAVQRDGEKCKVGISDFMEAIEIIKNAKLEIGING